MADEDGWIGLTWNYLPKYDDNFAMAGFDRTHVAQMGWLYELPFFKDRTDAVGEILGGWQINGVAAWFSGTPFSIGGTNNAMACQGCGSILINASGNLSRRVKPARLDRRLLRQEPTSRSRAASAWKASATRSATSSAARTCGTWTCRCSRRSSSAGSARKSGWRSPTSSTTRTGARRSRLHGAELPPVHAGQRRERHQHPGPAPDPDRPACFHSSFSRRAPGPCRGRASLSGPGTSAFAKRPAGRLRRDRRDPGLGFQAGRRDSLPPAPFPCRADPSPFTGQALRRAACRGDGVTACLGMEAWSGNPGFHVEFVRTPTPVASPEPFITSLREERESGAVTTSC